MPLLSRSHGIRLKMRGAVFERRMFRSCCRSNTRNLSQLAEMVEVVAGHGFYDGLKGHGAALGMDGRPGCGRGQSCVDESQIPPAQAGECFKRTGGSDAAIGRGPLLLVEGLECGRILGQCLAETKTERNLAVGQVADDLRGAPFTGGGRRCNFIRADDRQHLCKRVGCRGQNILKRPTVEKCVVRVEYAHRAISFRWGLWTTVHCSLSTVHCLHRYCCSICCQVGQSCEFCVSQTWNWCEMPRSERMRSRF